MLGGRCERLSSTCTIGKKKKEYAERSEEASIIGDESDRSEKTLGGDGKDS